MPLNERIKTLIQGWNTWDNYSLSVIYIKFIYYLTRSKNNKSLDNSFVRFMTQLLVMNIHPNFSKRLSVQGTIKRFDEFLGSSNKADLESIEEIIAHVEENRALIHNSIVVNSRKIQTLTEKTIAREI